MNKKRGIYNIISGVGSQVITIALGIIIPRLFLVSFGSEMNGFLNSVGQVFAYFALLEAGVGAATLQALYGPIAKEDRKSISGIMAATNQYYRRTGLVYFGAVIVLAIFYPIVVESSISKLTLMVIILINGLPGALSYFLQGKYTILLQAEGKNYITTTYTTIASTLISIFKIILLKLGCSIIIIQLSYLFFNVMKIIALEMYIKKNYSWINLKEKPNFKAIEQKNAAFINQICDLIFRNTDTIILTLFCNLKSVSVYAMYTLLFSMIRTALDYIAKGFLFIMGQTYNSDKKKFLVLYDFYESYRMGLIFCLYNVAYIFVLPFMKLYTSGITDVNYLDEKVALLFVVFYLLTGSRASEAELINYAQHFKLTQSRCVIEAAINLGVSLVCVQFWGVYGVLIGTIVALLFRTNDMFLYANHRILHRSAWVTYRRVISNTVTFVVLTLITSQFTWKLDSYFRIVGWASVSGFIFLIIYFTVASLVNRESWEVLKVYLKPIVQKLRSKKCI